MKPIDVFLFTIALGLSTTCVAAETWPSKPLKVVVPFAAGSSTDVIPRLILETLSPQLGQAIVIENRPGAGGSIGSAAVANSMPDGYTVLVNGSSHTIAPALYKNLSYDPSKDFAAVVPFGISPNVLVVSPKSHFKSVGDLVTAAKAKPGALNFSSVGVGTATHLSAERFLRSAGIKAMHIPFKGGGEAMTEAIAGRVDFFFGPVGLVLSSIQDGKLVALAVNSPKRAAMLPDIPTMQESGFDNAEYPIWYGLFLPAKTPRDIVEKLGSEASKTLRAPQIREKLARLGVDPMVMTPSEFDAHVRSEISVNAELVKSIGLEPQ